jgi:hypothetical protein
MARRELGLLAVAPRRRFAAAHHFEPSLAGCGKTHSGRLSSDLGSSEYFRSLLVLVMLAGCSGAASPGDGGAVSDNEVPGAIGGGTGGASGTGADPGGESACPTVQVAPTPLRRLTRFEYANTVRDLLGMDRSPANDLPADEVTNSFDNNARVLTVSSLHAEKYVLVSEALAAKAVQNLGALTSCDVAAQGEEACAVEFARRFGRRAFRRPITPEDAQLLMAAYAAGRTGGSYAEGIEVMIRAALQSPHFLYRLEITPPASAGQPLTPLDQFELATRLSYLVWSSGPDDALLDAASNGGLATPEQLAAKARDMLADPKARPALANFFTQWTSVSRLGVVSKDTERFPEFTPALRDAMARELPAFVEHVLWSADRTLATLLTAPVGFVSGPLADVYGVPAPPGSETAATLVTLPQDQSRAGILTQAGFLAVQGHPDQTSPVLRGKFVRAMLLCQPPAPPPPDVDISVPDIDQGGTARERFSAHLTAGTSCNGCHALMDPLGLAFEHFDAIGRYRETDDGRPIDVSGDVAGVNDAVLAGPFNGVRELAEKLAASSEVRDCVATHWFRFAAGRSEVGADACSLETLRGAFAASGGDLAEIVVAMTQSDAFRYRSP